MIIILSFILIFNKVFNNRERLIFTSFFLIGVFLITYNNYLIYESTGSYFSGSDATGYYIAALEINLSNLTFSEYVSSSRYLLYTVYQKLASFPFLESEEAASVLIKSSNWAISLLSVIYFRSCMRRKLGFSPQSRVFFEVFFYSTLILFLSIATYNFRDVLLVAFVVIVLSQLLYFDKNKPLYYLSLLIILSIRFFYVPVLILGYYLSKKLTYKDLHFKSISINTAVLFIPISLVSAFLFLMFFKNLLPIFNYVSTIFLGSPTYKDAFNYTVLDYLRSLVAGNPISYWMGNYSGERSFAITNINRLLYGFVFYISYFCLLYILTLPILLGYNQRAMRSIRNQSNSQMKSFMILNNTIIILFIFCAALYTIYLEGMQERIRVTILIPVLLVASIQSFFLKKSDIHLIVCLFLSILISTVLTIYELIM